MKFKSNAQWPKGTYDRLGNQTSDEHGSHETAQAVCDILMREGHIIHGATPIRTWVSEIVEEPDPELAPIFNEALKAKPKLVINADYEILKWGRNEPCPCGSGKKFKHCHIDRKEELL